MNRRWVTGWVITMVTIVAPILIHGAVVDDLITYSNSLGKNWLSTRLATYPTTNIVIAPPSVMGTLGIIGTGTAGKTRADWQSALGLSRKKQTDIIRGFSLFHSLLTDPTIDITLNTADSIWIQADSRLQEAFIKTSVEFYDAPVQKINFSAPDSLATIQKWISGKTNRMIQSFPSSLEPTASLLVLNTLFFKGDWQFPFNAKKTDDRLFISPGLPPIKTPMMVHFGRFQYAETREVQAIALPYGEGRFELVIVAPRQWTPPHLPWDYLAGSDSDAFEETPVTIVLPKFKLTVRNALRAPLSDAGFQSLFSPRADFSAISPTVKLSDIVQQVVVIVDESGTRAAATTAGTFGSTSVSTARPASIMLTRPFLYALRDTISGLYLFIGAYVAPEDSIDVP